MEYIADLHPLVVHFPIAFFCLFIVFEVIAFFSKSEYWNKTATVLLVAGVISGVGASLTGNLAAQTTLDKWEVVIANHENWATALQWYFTLLLVLKFTLIFKKKFEGILKTVFLVFSLFGFFMVFKAGDLGGKLVYRYGIGTELIEDKKIDE